MTQQSKPLITIIIAVFNGAKTLQHCIDSVAQQTYPNKQLIIIDANSTDGTVDLLKANNHIINYWISEPDKGIYSAWNKGLLKAEGDWLCFLGADDYFWDAQVLEKMSQALEKVPSDIAVVYGQIMLLSEEGDEMYLSGESWLTAKQKYIQTPSIPHTATMHRRAFFEQHGNFDESFRIAGDYEMLLRELKSADAMFIPKLITAGMRQGGVSSNPKNSLLSMKEIRRAQKKHGYPYPSALWIRALLRVYLRLLLSKILGDNLTAKFIDYFRQIIGLPAYWTKI